MATEGKQSAAATQSPAGGTGSGETKRDTLAEAIEKATATVTGSSATKDGASAKKPTETEGAAAAEADDTEEGAAEGAGEGEGDEGEEGEQDSAEGDGEPKPYTREELAALKPGDIFNLDMERVPAEYRDFVRGLKAVVTREYQALGNARKGTRSEQPTGDKDKPEAKKLSRQDLFDKANEGPEGFAEALDSYTDQRLSEFAETHGLTQERAEAERNDAIVTDAIAIATEAHPELSDPGFRKQVGNVMQGDSVMARRLESAITGRDPEKLAMVVEQATLRVKAARHNQTEKARQAAKRTKETSTATSVGSLAAESTTRGSSKQGGTKTLGDSLDEAIKATGSRSFA